ncbi:MAG: hypothetical protein LBK95_06470 [Bifidobacteriaceae bacterium]|jgi:hypothetical protein|nr:hypothetical protein [Bifidobacteriaceae bacterium]
MDAFEQGKTFAVIRDGRDIGEIVPVPRGRAFLGREEFVARGHGLPSVDAEAFRADFDASAGQVADGPFAR